MEEEKFMPAPWSAEITSNEHRTEFTILDASCRYHICSCSCDNTKLFEVMEANANLIAAAPKLYEAVKKHCIGCLMHDHETNCKDCFFGQVLKEARGEEN